MTLPLEIRTVFDFFADAYNLEMITPPELCFHILTPHPIEITEGTVIDYRLRLYGVPIPWRARITNWSPPNRFVDEQIRGPFRLWIHTHRFYDGKGSTTVVDEVCYQLPLRPMGEIAYPPVAALLRRIFRFRKQAIGRILHPKLIGSRFRVQGSKVTTSRITVPGFRVQGSKVQRNRER
jgi:ligand-binding SRPBCC domain-containing protein